MHFPWTPQLEALVNFGLQSENLEVFTKIGKLSMTPNSSEQEVHAYFGAFAKSYHSGRHERLLLKEVGTVADPAVDVILAAFAKITDEDTLALGRQLHRQAMAAENLLGALLERYLAHELEPHGWIWCAGNTIKAVDFISEDFSLALQVKNRSNSENSSSAGIRRGTTIKKWYRVNANTGRTNWEKFPASPTVPLSEERFHAFIHAYAKGEK